MTQPIRSRQNATFQRIRNTMRDRDAVVIEGRKMVADALAAGWTPELLVWRADDAGVNDDAQGEHVVLAKALFDQISDTRTAQGILAVFRRPPERDVFARRDAIVVALDGVQDPGNVGTIIRLAAAFDAAGVALLPGCADPFAPKAIRASAGAVLDVPVARVTAEDLEHRTLYAAGASGRAIDPPSRDAVLIFGSEGAGVSPALRDRATPIAIPMSGRIESLNVAAAAAILLSRSFALRSR